MDDILPVKLLSNQEICSVIAHRFRRRRLDYHNWPRHVLAERSGVTESTIKRFENRGQITLENLVKLACAMNAADEFQGLFPLPDVSSLKEVKQRQHKRQRGRARV